MDLFINIDDSKFSMNLFDKRDAFPFSIVGRPRVTSNIPSKMFCAVYGTKILRTARVTSTKTNIRNQCLTLISALINLMSNICQTLSKTFGNFWWALWNFYILYMYLCTYVSIKFKMLEKTTKFFQVSCIIIHEVNNVT